MTFENFTLPLTVRGKKVKAQCSKFKPSKEILYRVSVPWDKWERVFVFTLKDAKQREFKYHKLNHPEADALAEVIMSKLKKSTV